MAFETIQSELVYQGKAFNVRRDQVRMPDNQIAILDIVDHPGAVTLVPVDEQDRIWFVRQYRHSTGEVLLELPAGTLEVNEPPEQCAYREVREETGMAAGSLRKIGEFFLAPGYSTEFMYIFLATQLIEDPLQGDEDEFLSVEAIPAGVAFQMAESGQIRDAKSLAALFLARSYI